MSEKETEINEFLEKILGFSKPWIITKVKENIEKNEVEIFLDYPKGTKIRCPECGELCPVNDSRVRKLRHMDFWQHKTFINTRVPRTNCKCGKKRISLPFSRANSHFTIMFEKTF